MQLLTMWKKSVPLPLNAHGSVLQCVCKNISGKGVFWVSVHLQCSASSFTLSPPLTSIEWRINNALPQTTWPLYFFLSLSPLLQVVTLEKNLLLLCITWKKSTTEKINKQEIN